MKNICQEHRRRAEQIQRGIAVGLQFFQRSVAVKTVRGGGEQVFAQFLPAEHGGLFVLQQGVKVVLAAVGHIQRHIAHPPFIRREHVGPFAG